MWDYIIALGAFLFTSLGVLIAFLTLQEKKKRNKLEIYREELEKREENSAVRLELLLTKVKDEIKKSMRDDMNELFSLHIQENHRNLISADQSKADDERIWKKLDKIEKDLQVHFSESVNSEIVRLGTDIADFADDLRNGIEKSRSSYKHIAQCYDRYNRLGGNHYIDTEFAFIREKMMELNYEKD